MTTAWALATIGCSICCAQPKWPIGLRVELQPCTKVVSEGAEYAYVSGKLLADGKHGWPEVTLGARAVIDGPGGAKEYNASIELKHVSTVLANPFTTGFDRGSLKQGEHVVACEAFFVSGTRVVEKTESITLDGTLIAKDEDCLNDLASAMQVLKGLELRKKLTELVQYGCIELVPAGYVVRVAKSFVIGQNRIPAIDAAFERPYNLSGGEELMIGLTLRSFIGKGEVWALEKVTLTR